MNLAQINIARVRFPLDGPELKDFVDSLPKINALAEASPGYLWRLTDDGGADATGVRAFEQEDILLNLTLWESVESLRDFAYQTEHLEYMRRRREWFDYQGIPNHMALWWVPDNHLPTVEEAKDRLEHLTKHGPTAYSFTFRDSFPAPSEVVSPA